MVHSSSASPMKNSPSASPHFTAPAPPLSAPPLSAPPLSAPPVSAPPLSASPLSAPAPPLSAPAPPLSAPPPSAPPLSAHPLSAPPLSAPPPSAPPLFAPPLSDPAPPRSAPPLSAPPPSAPPPSAPPLSAPPLSDPAPPLFAPPLSDPAPPLSAPPPADTPGQGQGQDQDQDQDQEQDQDQDQGQDQDQDQGPARATGPSSAALDHGPRPSACSSALVSRAARGPVNGRTSGRKRTPKACDCCGPNSSGHVVRTWGRGRGRGRGRPGSNELWETPRRRVAGQLIRTKRRVHEGEDAGHEVLPGATSPEAGPGPGPEPGPEPEPDRGDALEKEVMLVEESGGEGGTDGATLDLRLSGGRSRLVAEGGTARGPFGRQGPDLKVDLRDRLDLRDQLDLRDRLDLRDQLDLRDRLDLRDQPDLSFIKSACGNGETVNLSDTEPEGDTKENFMPPLENGRLSGSGSPQDLDSDMQVDQTPPLLPPHNGDITPPSSEEQCCSTMEVEASPPAPPQTSITVSGGLHCWALRDHQLYCRPGTWDQDPPSEDGGDQEARSQEEEDGSEQLTDLIHEFLESFYLKYGGFIPLSETDVLEHVKKKNGGDDLVVRGLDIKKEVSRYRAGLASAPIAGFMVTYNKHTLSLEDLSTLEEQNWLNDQIINMYGELIMEATQHKVHFFNSFFHKQLVAKGYEGVKRWTKKVDLFSKWLLLIPIHLEIHWSLVTVTMATKTISYYDSQGIVFRHTTDNIMKYLLSEARERKQTLFQKGWKISIIRGIPQQKNDSDCGVFVLEYCRCLSVKQPLLFSQDDMPRIRKRIYKELCDCRLNH